MKNLFQHVSGSITYFTLCCVPEILATAEGRFNRPCRPVLAFELQFSNAWSAVSNARREGAKFPAETNPCDLSTQLQIFGATLVIELFER